MPAESLAISVQGVAPRRPLPKGAGLGLRRTFLDQALDLPAAAVDFWEIAPENWIGVGGPNGRKLRAVSERADLVCHGLSLSIGGPMPLDGEFIDRLKAFLDTHGVLYYTEHLSYCSDDGHLYDLMPIPFTEDAARYVATRIRDVQDRLERRIGIENVSYYAAPGAELTEIEFLNIVLEEADCDLHLDMNNVYVNSINHGYDPYEFLSQVPPERVQYGHVAGHYVEAPDLRIDTHGTDVSKAVWELTAHAFASFGVFPVAVERDFNIPPLPELLQDVHKLRELQQHFSRIVAGPGLAL